MPVCVKIMLSDEGVMSVQECEPKEEMGGEPAQEVETLDEAFSLAETILLGEGGEPDDMEEEAFSAGMGDVMSGTTPPMGKGGMKGGMQPSTNSYKWVVVKRHLTYDECHYHANN